MFIKELAEKRVVAITQSLQAKDAELNSLAVSRDEILTLIQFCIQERNALKVQLNETQTIIKNAV